MREIKFRAWDKIKCKMIYDYIEDNSIDRDSWTPLIDLKGNIDYYAEDDAGKNGLWEHIVNMTKDEKPTLMQYTGLKDKNGKEIYEGDIVKTNKGISEIFMRLGCWYVSMQNNLGYFGSKDLEVIGNIYENPELLKGDLK